MSLIVRVVRGTWVKSRDSWWEHVPEPDGGQYSISVRETDDYHKLVAEVKTKLRLRDEDEVELTYQWPQWMLGHNWKRAIPIGVEDDDDTALFIAIRADLPEIFLRVRVKFGNSEGLNIGVTGGTTISGLMAKRGTIGTEESGSEGVLTQKKTPPHYYEIGYDVRGATVVSGGMGKRQSIGTQEDEAKGFSSEKRGPPYYYRSVSPVELATDIAGEMTEKEKTSIPTEVSQGGGTYTAYGENIHGMPNGVSGLTGLTRTASIILAGLMEKRPTIKRQDGNGEGCSSKALTPPVTAYHYGISSDIREPTREGAGRTGKQSLSPGDICGPGVAYSQPGDNTGLRYRITTDVTAPIMLPGGGSLQRTTEKGIGNSGGLTPPNDCGRGKISAFTAFTVPVTGVTDGMNCTSNKRIGGETDGSNSAPTSDIPDDINNEVLLTQPAQKSFSTGSSPTSMESIPSSDSSSKNTPLPRCMPASVPIISLLGEAMRPRQIPVIPEVARTTIPMPSWARQSTPATYIPRQQQRQRNLDKGKGIAEEPITITEIGTSSRNPAIVQDTGKAQTAARVIPDIHDRDAPPYFDDPRSEDLLRRALGDVAYEGDDIFIGRVFKNKDDCKIKLAIHAIHRKFHFIYARSCPWEVIVVCVGDGCPWRVYAPKLDGSERFEVRCANLEHTCSVDARGDFHRQASTSVIGNLMRSRYGVGGRGPRANELRRMLRQEYSLHVSYWKAWRAREIAMDNAMGSAIGSFALIPPYFKLFLEANPGSVVGLDTEVDSRGVERFKYLFYSIAACAAGYRYMRKVLIIDGTHLSGRYGGCLVAASAQDGNFQVYPLAFGIVNSENDHAWEWFMVKLKEIVPDEPDLVIVSDRHASIYAAIRKVYPMASHATCLVHLQRNIQTLFKTEGLTYLVSQAGRAYRLTEFEKVFAEIKATHPGCAEYLEKIGFHHWARSHFVGERYNVMTSNISESLNNVLTMARDFPVISILESIRTTIVTWFAIRREAAAHDNDVINPKVQEILISNFEKAAGWLVIKIAEGIYEVRDKVGDSFAVHLWEQSCTCREFQLLAIPCPHAIAAAIQEGIRVETLVGVHYTVEYRRQSYAGLIMPVPDINSLTPSETDVAGGKLAPPTVRRPPGRPRKKRFFSTGEFKRVNKRRCTRCRVRGHNRSTCKLGTTDN